MTDAGIARRRLLKQRIAGARLGSAAEVVRWMGAMQAQDYRQALWAIGLRTQAATLADVERAIAEREIVRTWPMRGTLHFVAAENVRWMLELLAPRRLAADGTRQRQLELDEGILERGGRVFRDALQGGRRLSRPAMMKLLEDARIDPSGQRGYHILWYLAQTGLICLGPMQGREQTFVLLDEWVPAARRLARDDALAVLAGRYFAGHGPATVDDFAHWAGITLADARAGLEAVRPDLLSEKRDAKICWWAAATPGDDTPAVSGVYLLPGFDEYLLGYKDRGDVLAAEHAPAVVPGGNGVFLPMLVVDGQVAGTWKRSLGKRSVDVTPIPFAPLGASSEDVAAAAGRFAEFVGLPLSSPGRAQGVERLTPSGCTKRKGGHGGPQMCPRCESGSP